MLGVRDNSYVLDSRGLLYPDVASHEALFCTLIFKISGIMQMDIDDSEKVRYLLDLRGKLRRMIQLAGSYSKNPRLSGLFSKANELTPLP